MSLKKVINTTDAPDPVGPYNQAIKAGNFIYCSGQIAIDPIQMKLIAWVISRRKHSSFKKS